MSDFPAILKVLQEKSSFLLLPHQNIDGDDLGSMLALSRALEKMNKQVFLYCQDDLPGIYRFLPGLEKVKKTLPAQKVEVVILTECSKPSRIGEDIPIRNLGEIVLNLDHHSDNTFYGDYNLVEPQACALGEVIYPLLKALPVKFDQDMAIGLYTAILTDTGGFQYGNVTSRTHAILSELLKHEVPIEMIARKIYREKDFARLKLFGMVAATLERSSDSRLAWAEMNLQMLEKLGLAYEDSQNFVEELNQLNGVEVVALFKEQGPQEIRVSMRSSGFPVNEIAAAFGGGGHLQAAGCTIYADLEQAKQKILPLIEEKLK